MGLPLTSHPQNGEWEGRWWVVPMSGDVEDAWGGDGSGALEWTVGGEEMAMGHFLSHLSCEGVRHSVAFQN